MQAYLAYGVPKRDLKLFSLMQKVILSLKNKLLLIVLAFSYSFYVCSTGCLYGWRTLIYCSCNGVGDTKDETAYAQATNCKLSFYSGVLFFVCFQNQLTFDLPSYV